MNPVHPARRGALPDDPMELHAVEVSGDSDLLLRVLVEEYARVGWDEGAILGLARRPFFRGFHAFLLRYGEEELRRRIREILARTGVTRVRVHERDPKETAAARGDSLAGEEAAPSTERSSPLGAFGKAEGGGGERAGQPDRTNPGGDAAWHA